MDASVLGLIERSATSLIHFVFGGPRYARMCEIANSKFALTGDSPEHNYIKLVPAIDSDRVDLNDAYDSSTYGGEYWGEHFSLKITKLSMYAISLNTGADIVKLYRNPISITNAINVAADGAQLVAVVYGLSVLPVMTTKAAAQLYSGDTEGALATSAFTVGFYIAGAALTAYSSPAAVAVVGTTLILGSAIYGAYNLVNSVYNAYYWDLASATCHQFKFSDEEKSISQHYEVVELNGTVFYCYWGAASEQQL